MGGTALVDKLLIGRKLAQIDTYLKQIGDFSKISLISIQKQLENPEDC
jgi:hypothetical protein